MTECYLRYIIKDQEPCEMRITEFPCRIGRSKECEAVIPDGSISSLHAGLLLEDDGTLTLQDQNSTNGIYYNYKRVAEVAILGPTKVIMGKVHVELALTQEDFEDMQAVRLPREVTEIGIDMPPARRNAPADGGTKSIAPEAPPAPPPRQVPPPAAPARAVAPAIPQDVPAFSPAATISRIAGSGRGGIVCPHCWHRFDVDEFLFIARHQSLIGDPVLGADAAQRFLPSRFTPEGNALDAAGVSCPDMACPRCHLRIPQAASEMPPLFLSIVGATASGKSYFLTSMTWRLRNALSQNFAISFTDTDAVNNQILNDFEETVFLHADAEEIVALSKTELQGDLYNQVLLDNMLINLPKPFMFSIMPAEHHPEYDKVRESMSRTLVLYDNAGEHFEPGMDSVDNPTTQHLLHADTIFFLFDPTKDVRFRKRLVGVDDPQLDARARVQRQEIILTEMINRIKKYSGLHARSKSGMTMMFLVSKFDAWKHLLDMELPEEPWLWTSELNTCALDMDLIKNVSFQVRQLLVSLCPEIVSIAESFSGDVLYLPNSALGHSPEMNEETGMIGIRPVDVAPIWVEVPMLVFFWERGFIPSLPEAYREHHECVEAECKLSGDVFFIMLPGLRKPLQVPVCFAGYELQCPDTGAWFKVPELQR